MHQYIKNIKIGARLLYESVFYFMFSYITIFISIFTIKVVEGNEIVKVFIKPEIILAFLAAIPTYLIGIHYMAHDNKKKSKNILLLTIVISIALFGIVFNVKTIKDIRTIEYMTYTMLLISLVFTLLLKVDFSELNDDIKRQNRADISREKTEKVLPDGRKISL